MPAAQTSPSTALATTNTYARLVSALAKEIARGLLDIQRYAETRKVKIYWNQGRLITRFLAANTPVSGHELYGRLSKDLHVNERTLQQCAQFFREYPKLDAKVCLSWSHYRCLMMVSDLSERQQWEKKILRQKLTASELFALLQDKKDELILQAAPPETEDVQRGTLYAYRLIKAANVGSDEDAFMVDCGFEIRIMPPPASGQLDNTRIVQSQKDQDGYQLKLSNTTVSQIYTYKSIVERVIDGDTLLVNVDVGFGIWCRQRLRLRGIDAPELRTVDGEKAKRWLQKELATCPFIVAKTYKTDKYDRYLVDVFYSPENDDPQSVADSGILLNRRLLQLGLAVEWVPG